MVPNIKANKLVGIAVVSPKRIPLLPDVPTMAESGYPGVTMGQWFGIVGPANMPKEATDLLNKNINEIFQLPEEIGRASCRERGCKYVLVAVGAVSIKKNTTTTQQNKEKRK